MSDRRVLLISAGLLEPKKPKNAAARCQLYLNYGLLGLASVLASKGYDPRLFHGRYLQPPDFLKKVSDAGWLNTSLPILLSLPSCFALPWAREVCRLIKISAPDAKIVVGGRWVVAFDGEWIRRQLPDVDLVVFGTAEQRIHAILDPRRWHFLPGTDFTGNREQEPTSREFPRLNYRLMDDFAEYQPSIEVSRGCGMGCSYCAEARAPLGDLKDASLLAEELTEIAGVYGDTKFHPYFESSFFRPTSQWIRELGAQLEAHGLTLSWRTESRVDGMSPTQVANLSRAGLKVLDLGLESASPQQLVAMDKTSAPDTYLRRAAELLAACRDNGVWAKVNILLFPGETQRTIEQTHAWLERHASCIKGISASPTIVYRFGPESTDYLQKLTALGARPVRRLALDELGYAHLHLSESLDHDGAREASETIARAFMSPRDYFELKAFSYFPRSYTWSQYVNTVDVLAGSAAGHLGQDHSSL